MEKADKKMKLNNLRGSWDVLQEELDRNIKVLESLIFSVSPENNTIIYTARDLNIAKREILVKLKGLPEKLLENLEDAYLQDDIMKEFIDFQKEVL